MTMRPIKRLVWKDLIDLFQIRRIGTSGKGVDGRTSSGPRLRCPNLPPTLDPLPTQHIWGVKVFWVFLTGNNQAFSGSTPHKVQFDNPQKLWWVNVFLILLDGPSKTFVWSTFAGSY